MFGQPDRADELDRIESCGGKVLNWNGHRVLGVLATSRSIGRPGKHTIIIRTDNNIIVP